MGAAPRPRVQRVQKGRFLGLTGLAAGGFLSLTGLWPPVIVPPPAGGRWYAVPKGERVLKVLKFDGPSGRGWWIALMGNAYKVSVTGLAFCVIWHDKHSGDWLTAFATPYSAVPDFSTGKHVTRFSGRFASLRIVFPCHPYAGGRIKHRETIFS